MPKLSVVIPVYNIEKYVDRCLGSLADQTYKDFEVICVNDGSTDGSLQKLQEWASKDSRIKILDQENAGPSAARNAGIKAAQGEYVSFLDGDDRYYPMACESIVELLDTSAADVVVFGATYVPEKAGNAWYYWALSPRNVTYDHFSFDIITKESSRPFIWKMAFRTAFLRDNDIYLDESVRFGEDQIFCFAVYPRASKVRFSSKKLYEYRLARDGSAMDELSTDVHAKMLKHAVVVERVFADWAKLGILHTYASQMLPLALNFVLNDLMNVPQDQFADVCAHFASALRENVTLEDVLSVPGKEDREFLVDLYKRNDRNLGRRKWNARGFYRLRHKNADVVRWALSSWYPKA